MTHSELRASIISLTNELVEAAEGHFIRKGISFDRDLFQARTKPMVEHIAEQAHFEASSVFSLLRLP